MARKGAVKARDNSRVPPAPASPDELEALGTYALQYVRPGQTIGLGTGHAASAFIRALGASANKVRGVPTSKASEALARSLGIELVDLREVRRLDADFDGADEVDPRLNMIKGWGGAMVREKIVAAASKRRFFLVGAEKCVKRLGERGRLPVEVLPLAVNHVIRAIAQLGIRAAVRRNETGGEVLTDNGNSIVDCAVSPIRNPARLESGLLAIPGVVGTGLFLGFADVVLVASRGEIKVVHPRADHRA